MVKLNAVMSSHCTELEQILRGLELNVSSAVDDVTSATTEYVVADPVPETDSVNSYEATHFEDVTSEMSSNNGVLDSVCFITEEEAASSTMSTDVHGVGLLVVEPPHSVPTSDAVLMGGRDDEACAGAACLNVAEFEVSTNAVDDSELTGIWNLKSTSRVPSITGAYTEFVEFDTTSIDFEETACNCGASDAGVCEVYLPDSMDTIHLEDESVDMRTKTLLEILISVIHDNEAEADPSIDVTSKNYTDDTDNVACVEGTECEICFAVNTSTERLCCGFNVCSDCTKRYLATRISEARVKIRCPNTGCDASISRDEIFRILHGDDELEQRYIQFLVDANQEPHRKTCPRCSHITEVDPKSLTDQPKKVKKFGMLVTCVECRLDWCFSCQAPWHESISCKNYRRGDKLLKDWSKLQNDGQRNAQKCPKCKTMIQRSEGCDHMTCSRCSTNFCYLCGEKYRGLKYLGNHHTKLSVFGCKYSYKPHQPAQRRLIRGTIFGSVLLASPVLASLALVAAAIGLPIYGVYRLHKLRVERRQSRQRRQLDDVFIRQLEELLRQRMIYAATDDLEEAARLRLEIIRLTTV